MSFSKAEQLLQLATMVSTRHLGLSLDEITEAFKISHRTAQRMTRALELQFPDTETFEGADGRKRWRLSQSHLRDLMTVSAEELAALELAINQLTRLNSLPEAHALRHLQAKIISLIPRSRTRLEPDYDALLEAQGFVARPGPKPRMNEKVHVKLVEAIKACRSITFKYRSNKDRAETSRTVSPLGFLSGTRRYLVAEDPADKRGARIKTYRVDAISSVTIEDDYFQRPDNFNLQDFANAAFGVYQRDEDITDIVWRFSPDAAEQAMSYQFHPNQTEVRESDGSLLVKFQSAGLLEMAWYLYTWGDKVEVLEPQDLKDMVQNHRRSDFPALP